MWTRRRPRLCLPVLAAAACVAVLLAACGDGMGPMHDADGDGLIRGRTPEAFYAANCSSCHGQGRDGGIGPPLRPETLSEDDATYARIIRDGVPRSPMPAWGRQLSDEQIEALIAFLRTEP